VLVWTEPARTQLGLDLQLPERNGAQRAREALDSGASIEDIYRDAVAETRRTYSGSKAADRA
jgi:carboxylate-amine ligase